MSHPMSYVCTCGAEFSSPEIRDGCFAAHGTESTAATRDRLALDEIVLVFTQRRPKGWRSAEAYGHMLDEIEEVIRKTGRVI